MKIINLTLLAFLFIFPFISMSQEQTESKYMYTPYTDYIPQANGKMVKKHIKMEGIENYYYIYQDRRSQNKKLYIVFHGEKNNTEDFMRNTGLHQRFERKGYDYIFFSSIGGKGWYNNEEKNERFVKTILNRLSLGRYREVGFIGYAGGGTFASDIYCQNKWVQIKSIWNVNGTLNKNCNFSDDLTYNLFFGSEMDISDQPNGYYKDYGDIIKKLRDRGDCNIGSRIMEHGSKMSPVYLERIQLNCISENKSNIFEAVNMGRNFPYTNKLDLDGFQGKEIESFDFINFIESVSYF